MKKLIRASAICIWPIVILSIIIPIGTAVNDNGLIYDKKVFVIYLSILIVCLSIVTVTVLLLQKFANKINTLDEEMIKIVDKERELDRLIEIINSQL